MLTKREVVLERLRSLIGQSVEVEYSDNGKKVGVGPQLLIGVTETSAEVWADFVEGTSLKISIVDLQIEVLTSVDPHDAQLFRECFARGYYPGLPLNDRLRSLLQSPVLVST